MALTGRASDTRGISFILLIRILGVFDPPHIRGLYSRANFRTGATINSEVLICYDSDNDYLLCEPEVLVAIEKLKSLPEYENQLKNITRTHKLHSYVMKDLYDQASELKQGLMDYAKVINR